MKWAWAVIALAACGGGLIHVKETKPVVVTGAAPAAEEPPPEKPPEKITVKQDRTIAEQGSGILYVRELSYKLP